MVDGCSFLSLGWKKKTNKKQPEHKIKVSQKRKVEKSDTKRNERWHKHNHYQKCICHIPLSPDEMHSAREGQTLCFVFALVWKCRKCFFFCFFAMFGWIIFVIIAWIDLLPSAVAEPAREENIFRIYGFQIRCCWCFVKKANIFSTFPALVL